MSPTTRHPGEFSYLRLSDLSDAQLASLLCPSETEEGKQTLKEHKDLVACSALQKPNFPWVTANYQNFPETHAGHHIKTITSDTQPYEAGDRSMSRMTRICSINKGVLLATVKAIPSWVKMLFPDPNYIDIETLKKTYSNPSNFQDSTATHLAFIGSLWLQHGENEQAKTYYQAAIKKDPDCLIAKINLGTEETIKNLCDQVLEDELYLHSQVETFMLFVAAMRHCDNDTVRSLWENEDIKNKLMSYDQHPPILQCLQSWQAMAFPKTYSRAPKKPAICPFEFTMEAALWTGHTEVVATLLDKVLPGIAHIAWNDTNSPPHRLRDWILKTAVLSGKPEVVHFLITHEGFLPKNVPEKLSNPLITESIDWLLDNSEDTAEGATALHDMLAELSGHGKYLAQQTCKLIAGFQTRHWLLRQAIKFNKPHLTHKLLKDQDFWSRDDPNKPWPGMPQSFQMRHWLIAKVIQFGNIDLLNQLLENQDFWSRDDPNKPWPEAKEGFQMRHWLIETTVQYKNKKLFNQFLRDPRFWQKKELNKPCPKAKKGFQMRHWLIAKVIQFRNIDLLNQLLENQDFWSREDPNKPWPEAKEGFQMRHWLTWEVIKSGNTNLLNQLLENQDFWSRDDSNKPWPGMPQSFQMRHWLIGITILNGNTDILTLLLKNQRFWRRRESDNDFPGMRKGFKMYHWLATSAIQSGKIALLDQYLKSQGYWSEKEFNTRWPEEPEDFQIRHVLIDSAIQDIKKIELFDQFLEDPRFWHKGELDNPCSVIAGLQMRHWLINRAILWKNTDLLNQFLEDRRFWHEGELNKAWPEQPEGFQMRHWLIDTAVKYENIELFDQLIKNLIYWHEDEFNQPYPGMPQGFQMRHWPLFMAVKHRNLKSFKALLQNPAIPPFKKLRFPVKRALIEDISKLPKGLPNQFMNLLNPGTQKRKQNSTDKSKSTAQMTDRLRRAKRAKIKTPSPKGKTAKPAKRAPGTTDHAAAKKGTTAPKRMKRSN